MRPGLIVTAALALLVSACGANDREPAASEPEIRVIGGTAEQQALLTTIVADSDGASIQSVEIGKPPGCPDDCPDPEHPDDAWVYVTAAAPTRGPAGVRAFWDALLVAGAFRDESHARQLPPVLGKTIEVRFADGTTDEGGETIISQPPEHAIRETTDEELTAMVTSAVAGDGVSVDSVEIVRPLENAVLVTITVEDAKAFIERRDEVLYRLGEQIAQGDAPRAEGLYVQVVDSSGAPVTASGYSVRTGEGVGWIQPELDVLRPG
jgi:hypothetical protein